MALAEISTKLKAALSKQKTSVSKAPPPAKKVTGGGGVPKKAPNKMTAEEWAIEQGYKKKG